MFLLLAERTPALGDPRDEDPAMGLELHDVDIPDLAARAGIDATEFRRLLRVLKESVPMDVLEHADGVWEIVYGPSYTDRKKPTPGTGATREVPDASPQAFGMPGWIRYSTWGYEDGLGQRMAAQVADDPRAERRRRLTEPDLQYAEFCDRTGTPWRSTLQGDLAWTVYQAERHRRGETDEDPFEAYNPFQQGRR
ncbi:hypothetical protein [Actinacidiphila soli]|uniref:hypothetical protein n=1 Tax=Actinacidiphila soli TaxID=2487275 RepID=UPI000FCB7C7F|nr:hypothetical protein [Actinacidiphila soli]